jgi:hypothetical protein
LAILLETNLIITYTINKRKNSPKAKAVPLVLSVLPDLSKNLIPAYSFRAYIEALKIVAYIIINKNIKKIVEMISK